jgi:hypothetical protein
MSDTGELIVRREAVPAQDFGQVLLDLLRDPNIPADKLEVVLRFHAENLERQQRETFNNAFARLAAELPQVSRDGLVELISRDGRHLGSYRYTRWEDMDAIIRPILAKHGFALAFRSKESPERVWVQGELVFGGYSKFSEVTLPPDVGPGRNALQAWGGAISYGKRYTAEMLLNIVRKDIDNDAITALERKIAPTQVGELSRLLEETRTKTDYFLRMMVSGIEKLEDVRARDYERLINALEEKKRTAKARGGAS